MSTQPHSEGYLLSRLAHDQGRPALQPSEEASESLNFTGPQHTNPELNHPISIRGASFERKFPTARIILSLSPTLGNVSPSLDAYGCRASGQIYAIVQNSMKPYFAFKSDPLSCRFTYVPWDEGLVIRNDGVKPITCVPSADHEDRESVDHLSLPPGEVGAMRPGHWSILGSQGRVLCEMVLLRRRYCWERSAAHRSGTKRKPEPCAVARPTTERGLARAHSPSPSTDLALIRAENPLGTLGLEQRVSISIPIRGGGGTLRGNDTYQISNSRDIFRKESAAACVFRGKHSRLGDVAVKVLRLSQIPESEDIKRQRPESRQRQEIRLINLAKSWENEIRCLQFVTHESIIKLLGWDARFLSIYLSYHTSTDLSAWRTGSRFSGTNEDAETILSHIASALGYLHKQNIIHNDIKPRNILYDADRGPTLIDFGLATHAGSRPCLGGTAWYVPPELMFDNKRSFESDVFALGITLLFLLRKVELPDLARPNWAIWRVGNGGQGAAKDRSTMVEWLTEVEDLRESLGERKLERVVKDMLVIDPGERILAEDIPNQLQAT